MNNILSNIQLIFTRELWEELLFMTKELAPFEVSGLGEIEVSYLGKIVVRKLHLLKQEARGGETELNSEKVVELMNEIAVRPSHTDRKNWQLRLWWHTHADGEVFWSSVDERCCKGLQGSAGWFVSVVVNTRGSALARIDGEGEFGRYATPIRVVIKSTLTEKRKNLLKKEIKEKVEKMEEVEIGVPDWKMDELEKQEADIGGVEE